MNATVEDLTASVTEGIRRAPSTPFVDGATWILDPGGELHGDHRHGATRSTTGSVPR